MEYVDQIEYAFQNPSSGDPSTATTNHTNTPNRTQHQQNPILFPPYVFYRTLINRCI